MNAPVPALTTVNIPSLQMEETELIRVLESSVYPGASLDSIKLVIGYCKGQNLDPLQKPVHIVPMDVKTGEKDGDGKDIYKKRDVIMPGIGLYRTQAARTGQYIGISEPEFGPPQVLRFREKVWEDDKQKWVDADMEYPEWCRVTVRRQMGGIVAEFTAIEYWDENYATAGRNSKAPNAMWRRRRRGQLAKCTEAQALRKAFPEFGAQPTAEEMEGKSFDDPGGAIIDGTATTVDPQPKLPSVQMPKSKSEPPPRTETKPERKDPPPVDDGPIKESQLKLIRAKMAGAALSDIDLIAKFGQIDTLKSSQVNAILDWIKNPAPGGDEE